MNKKILFIVPPHGAFDSYKPTKAGQKKYFLTPPYGVLSILSYINEHKRYDALVFDCNKVIFENIDSNNLKKTVSYKLEQAILQFNPDYTCISALFNTSFSHMEMAQEIKSYYHKTTILVGGGLATNLYKELLDTFPAIDAICYGEGELPVKKLLDSDLPIDKLHTISPAWVTQHSLTENIVPNHDMIHNIDTIPLIDFSYIDIKKYNGRSYIVKDPTVEKVEMSIHTSRGCPFNCVFCANSKLHGKKIRMLSLERVLETIKYYKDNYGVTILLIEDDHFLHNKDRVIKILKYIKDNNISVEFPNGLAVYNIDEDIAKALADAQVKVVTLAIESGSDYVLKTLIDKPHDTTKIRKAVNILKAYNIRTHVFIVLGIPGELDSHRAETLAFLLSLEIDWVYVFIAIPIAGSRLFDICKENNYLISDSYDNHIASRGSIKAPGVDPIKIEEYAYYMNTLVNFIYNANVLNNRHEIAEEYFLNVIRSYPKQVIAHHMLAQIYEQTKPAKSKYHIKQYHKFYDEHLGPYKNSSYWSTLLNTHLHKGE